MKPEWIAFGVLVIVGGLALFLAKRLGDLKKSGQTKEKKNSPIAFLFNGHEGSIDGGGGDG